MAGRWLGLDLGGTNIKSVVLDDVAGRRVRSAGRRCRARPIDGDRQPRRGRHRGDRAVGAGRRRGRRRAGVVRRPHRSDRVLPQPAGSVAGRTDDRPAGSRVRRADIDHQRRPGVHPRRVAARCGSRMRDGRRAGPRHRHRRRGRRRWPAALRPHGTGRRVVAPGGRPGRPAVLVREPRLSGSARRFRGDHPPGRNGDGARGVRCRERAATSRPALPSPRSPTISASPSPTS